MSRLVVVIYVDTNVLMGILCPEPLTAVLQKWFAASEGTLLVTSPWTRTELASALGIKQRMRQLGSVEADAALKLGHEILTSTRCESIQDSDFEEAMILCNNRNWNLRAPDALHLAVAKRAGCKSIATLDEVMQKASRKIGLKPVKFTQ